MTEKITVKDVLKIIGVSSLAISSIALPGIAVAYSHIGREWRKYKKGDIGRIVKRLYKQDLLSISEKNGETILKLSDKGKAKLIKYNFDEIYLPKHRDGKLRIVSFDIPEKKKLAREVFRKKLKELEFHQIQESIFITAYPCRQQIEFVTSLLGISQHVILFQLGKIELGPDYIFNKYK